MSFRNNPPPPAYNNKIAASTHLDTLFDDETNARLLQARRAAGSGSAPPFGPPQPEPLRNPPREPVLLNPAGFPKAMANEESQRPRSSNFVYGFCSFLAAVTILLLMGTAIFTGENRKPPTVKKEPATPALDNDSLSDTGGSELAFSLARLYADTPAGTSPAVLIESNATLPYSGEATSGDDTITEENPDNE